MEEEEEAVWSTGEGGSGDAGLDSTMDEGCGRKQRHGGCKLAGNEGWKVGEWEMGLGKKTGVGSEKWRSQCRIRGGRTRQQEGVVKQALEGINIIYRDYYDIIMTSLMLSF